MKKRILFVCTGNSARSQLAEAIINRDYSDKFTAFSAGSSPKEIDPRTFSTLEAHGYSTHNIESKPLETFDGKAFDFLITLCSSAQAECATIPGVSEMIAWDIPQPTLKAINDDFEPTLIELEKRIHLFSVVQSEEPEDSLDTNTLFKCLSDKTRLMIASLLHIENELTVSELTEALQETQPAISRAVAVLRRNRIIKDRRQGAWVFYAIEPSLPDWASAILEQTVVARHHQLRSAISLLNGTDRPKIDHTRT